MQDISFNKTKIIATVGPSCNSKETLKELIHTGVDVFRLNFSHGDHGQHMEVIKMVRQLNNELGSHICLLQDLQGPKIRIDDVEEGIFLNAGQDLIITTEKIMGNNSIVSTNYSNLPKEIKVHHRIILDDGNIELKVKEIKDVEVITEVVFGKELKSRKGMNFPDTHVSVPSLTEKDRKDLEFGIENNIEWIALSFVREAQDIHDLRDIINRSGKDLKVVAKIEKPEALKNIDEIIEAADAIMVARGDLGVEIVMEEVPMAQKSIVRKCNLASKPVIIATQMMESMIENPRPTRAETSDVANSVMDGADALMLSAETATGKYPVKVIQSMVDTIASVEKQDSIYYKFYPVKPGDTLFYNNSLVLASVHLAKETEATAIIGMTQSGYNAFRLASYRPKTAIFIFTGNKPLLNTMNLIWGVRGYYYDKSESTDSTIADIEQILKDSGHIEKGDVFINTASMPIRDKARTNMIKITVAK